MPVRANSMGLPTRCSVPAGVTGKRVAHTRVPFAWVALGLGLGLVAAILAIAGGAGIVALTRTYTHSHPHPVLIPTY